MDISLLLKGFIAGFIISAPVGPIGMLCLNRALTEGRIRGLASGLGGATSDALFGLIIGLGLTFVSRFLIDHLMWFKVVGGIFIIIIGITFFISDQSKYSVTAADTGVMSAFLTAFIVSCTNPVTLISMTAMLAGVGVGNMDGNYLNLLILVAGIFVGSSSWWFALNTAMRILDDKINISAKAMRILKSSLGSVLVILGMVSIFSGIFKF